jgi:predicted TIM-barrel fold metal-dependent hydrolase
MKHSTLLFSVILFLGFSAFAQKEAANRLLLRNFRPVSIYAIPVNIPAKAKFPVIDMHSHAYAGNEKELEDWVRTMDEMGIEKTIILSGTTGAQFDSLVAVYGKYPERFELWCGFDYTGYDKPGFGPEAVKELERCYKKGAKGVGELGDKGEGELYSKPVHGYGMHLDDMRLKPLLQKCAELHMPVNIHEAESYWMYLPSDSTNDGLMNAAIWKVNLKPGMLDHDQLVQSLENAVSQNPNTIFIACHFLNCDYDLSQAGMLLDKYPNLYLDIAARYAETATIPRYMSKFYDKYQDRLFYGTDMGMEKHMYQVTFRVLETLDEHFYESELFGYHWAMNGFALNDTILQKLYFSNAQNIRRYENNR